MATPLNISDLGSLSNILYKEMQNGCIPKINKLVIKGLDNIGILDKNLLSISSIKTITINDMIQVNDLLLVIENSVNMHYTMANILHVNIHNIKLYGTFANRIYKGDDTIFINLPFNRHNCYFLQSISELGQNTHSTHLYTTESILPILYTNNPLLFRIISLTKMIKSSFSLSEYMMTELILFSTTIDRNVYFDNILQFIQYTQDHNIHIENIYMYKQLYNESVHYIFQYLVRYFNLRNMKFNLDSNIDILHANHWREFIILYDKNIIPNSLMHHYFNF